jgi:FMN phosphatase YigB (HAD superfamily)
MHARYLSLDFEGTLIESGCYDWFWRQLIPSIYAKKKGVDIEEAKKKIYRDYDSVGPEKPEWYIPIYWFRKYSIENEYTNALKSLLKRIRPMPDVKELKIPKGVEVIICSGAWEDIIRLSLGKIGLRDVVKDIFVPSSFGLAKKDVVFYEKVATLLNLENTLSILHVGDNLRYDYYEPLKAGWKAILLDRNNIYSNIQTRFKQKQKIVGINSLRFLEECLKSDNVCSFPK